MSGYSFRHHAPVQQKASRLSTVSMAPSDVSEFLVSCNVSGMKVYTSSVKDSSFSSASHPRKMQSVLRPLSWALKLTGLYFKSHKRLGHKWDIVENARLVLLVVCVLCAGSFPVSLMIHLDFSKGLQDIMVSLTLLMIIWSTQAIICLLYLFYWQRSGLFDEFAELVERHCEAQGCIAHSAQITVRYAVYFTLAIIYMSVKVVLSALPTEAFGLESQLRDIKAKFDGLLDRQYLQVLITCAAVWSNLAWVLVIIFFSICNSCLVQEIVYFNEQLEAQSKGLKNAPVIQTFFLWHTDLCTIIEHLNKMFNTFVFFMIATNIPLLILGLHVIAANMNAEPLLLATFLLGALYTLGQLLALSLTPARIHDNIHQAREIIFHEKSVWVPYNQEVFDFATMFCGKLGEGSIGISIWGYVIITKPLLLTVLSLIITYLVLLLQFDSSSNHPEMFATSNETLFEAISKGL